LLPSGTRRRLWSAELERMRREQRVSGSLTFGALVEAYLEQHEVDR
jgi:hypothetical protein